MEKQEYDALVKEVGAQAAEAIQKRGDELQAKYNQLWVDAQKGLVKEDDLKALMKVEMEEFNVQIKKMEQLEKALQTQGTQLTELMTGKSGGSADKSLEDFFKDKMDDIQKMFKAGVGVMEFTSDELTKAGYRLTRKAAGETSIGGNTIATMAGSSLTSPYLPGIGGTPLEIFDIIRNPNFLINRVDSGTTDQSTMAWINETTVTGTDDVASSNVTEGSTKTLVQHKFQVEYSKAKKAAAYVHLTEEFQDDVPQLASEVRTMLQQDVLRALDDAIQAFAILNARPYEITGLTGAVPYSTLYDAVWSMWAQIGFYNFVANTIAMNTVTDAKMMMDKSAYNYWTPPFIDRLMALLVDANKIAVNFALVGDLSQIRLRMYKAFTLRVGWINDDLIVNKFCIVGELRYHLVISDNRKKALCYNSLLGVQQAITAGS